MFVGRNDELATVLGALGVGRDTPGYAEIINLYGLFGAGKSTLLRLLRSRIEQEHLADALFVSGEDIDTSTIPEFVYQLAAGFQSLDPAVPRLSGDETEARRRRYLQIIGNLPADARPMLGELEKISSGGDRHYGERQLDADIFAFEVAVRNQFNNADDQRLTLDTGNVMAEAFIVDLINTFFPLGSDFPSLDTYLEKGHPPRRIIIAIDTYEKITPLVNPWLLESLLPYLYQKRFGDFQSYKTPFIPDMIHVRRFIDARLIIAGRERLTLTDQERRWDRYRDTLREIRVAVFTREEVTEYLKRMSFDTGIVDTVMDQTHGLPYLVALWVDAARAEQEGTERTTINALAQQRIFWYKTPEQREWIRAAAFLDWFDVDALRCFETIGDGADRAFEYLRNASEVAGPSRTREGKFEVHPIIRSTLRQATDQESGERADEFSEAASAFYGASELLGRFSPQDKKLLRRLAYFSRFDEPALVKQFGGEAHLVRDLIDGAEDLFEPGRFTTSLKAEPAGRLRRYNRYADRRLYQQRLDELGRLWLERAAELESQERDLEQQLVALESQLRARQSEQILKGDLQRRAALGMGDLDSELHTVRKRWNRSLSPKDAMVARTSFFFMVVMFVVVFFADLIPVDDQMRDIIRTAALGLFGLFLLTFSLMLGRIFYMRSRRSEHQALREDVASVEGRLISRQREFHELGADAERVVGEINALAERIGVLNVAIEETRLRLQEPYV